MIDHSTVEKIKNTADIVEVVSDYVHLIRRGANYMGLCPFHNERTPSFSVNKQRNFCYCFSCKKGGSPVNFIMEKEGLSYHEALLHLAKKYGIEVVEKDLTDEERERLSQREAMFVANEWAMKKMESDLTDTEEGREIGLSYLTERGVTDEAIKAFHLGYSLDKGQALTDAARKAGFNLDVLKALGLVGTNQQGRDYDKFRGRVMFPILNSSGKVIAFGGRDLKGGLAKYINSPESDLYKKSNELYGIFQAKSSIVSENKCFLVEGYMDVIGMWQSGMKNVVASSGTALTDGQIAMIHRFTDNITLIYDGDNAGIKASLRGIDMLLSHKLNVKVLLLPDGEDPDSFAKNHTPEEFKKYVEENETDIIRYKAKVMLDRVKSDPQNRINAINSVVESIAHIPDQVARDVYVQECSDILGIPEHTISKSVAKARAKIVENIKRERTKQTFPLDTKNAKSEGVQGFSDKDVSDSTFREGKKIIAEKSPLYEPEKNLLKYCVRYAFMPFCSYPVNEPDNEENSATRIISLNVLEYVKEELAQSEMSFSIELFQKVFELLEEMQPQFELYLSKRMLEIEENCERLRKEGYESIREADLSVAQIKREEQKLEAKIDAYREESRKQLIQDFPGRILGSHENGDIRKIALELVLEKHHLSNIYLKEGATELEVDRLSVLVVRAIDELKNELINLKIKTLFEEFRKASSEANHEEEARIQNELNSLMALRTEMAKCIGERIIKG